MATNILVPQLGESIVEATVGQWLKQEGDAISVGDVLVELETDKVDVEVGAEKTGVLARIERQEGEDVKVGEVLGIIEEGKIAPNEATTTTQTETRPAPQEKPAPQLQPEADKERATPVAKRLAEEQGVDLAGVSGSGPGGRVTKQDVQTHLQQRAEPRPDEKPQPAAPTAAPERPKPGPSAPAPAPVLATAQPEPEERLRMSRRRRTIAQRLVEAQQTAAMLTTFNEIDMSAVMELRQRRQDTFVKRHDVKLGFMSFFVKAVIGGLKAFPRLNAEIQGDEIVLKHYYDIGIAVGAEEGLVVPVLRAADRQSFAQIEQEVRDFVQKVRDGSLTLEDLRGGTFTITNGGVFGSLLSTPILNPPQVGILGMHKIEERPIALNGAVVIRPMMYVALSYDHRIVDGQEAVQFLVRVKELVEDPESLLLEG